MDNKTPAAAAAANPAMASSLAPTASVEAGGNLFSWYGDASPREKRAFWSCKVGYMLDGMDTQMLSFVIPTLIATWGISLADAGFIGTLTLLASALGGWAAGILSDRIGRVRTLQLTVVWFAVFTGLCGLAQNYEQLLAARALMGFGFGGEWTAGAVLIGEVIRAKDRGKAVGLVQSGWAIGWGLTAILYSVLFSVMPAELAWRALFLIGLLPALLVVVIRRYVKEPDVYEKEKAAQGKASDRPRFTEIFSPKLLSTTVRAALLATGAQGGYYAITTWLPTYLKTERHLTVMGTGGYLAMIIFGSWIGYLVSSYLTDRLGRKPNFILFAVGSMTVAFGYTMLPLSNGAMFWLGFPLGFFASGIFSGMGAFLTELFPTRVRGSGQGFCYNFGRAVGALFPFLIGALSKQYGLGASIGIFAAAAYGVLIIAALTLPETRGRELEAAGM
ncbi:MFS transporter [Burkholderiaceae bacterium 16]|nr:MFS transporter [Burkholderiaceae bacterium 16]